jgi:hypothetical protein
MIGSTRRTQSTLPQTPFDLAASAEGEPVPGKANFDAIYDAADARPYYSTLRDVQYRIPQHGADVLKQLLDAFPGDRDDRRTVLDLCCSYGVGGALAKTGLELDDLSRHYQNAADAGLSDERLIQADIDLLAGDVLADAPRVIGLDVAANAARYAVAIGALDDAFAENLEQNDASAELVRQMQEVDLITTTGGVGYVTERTFSRLLNATPKRPWVAAFCLRTYDYKPIADALATYGLVTEKAERSFSQRRFVDDAEQRWAMSEVSGRGLDPTGLESAGHCYADFYLSRPPRDASERPLAELIPAGHLSR